MQPALPLPMHRCCSSNGLWNRWLGCLAIMAMWFLFSGTGEFSPV